MQLHPANYVSALAFELLHEPFLEDCDFLRIKFKNSINDNFQTYHPFSHKVDIPLIEFTYRIEVGYRPSSSSLTDIAFPHRTMPSLPRSSGLWHAVLATATLTSTSVPSMVLARPSLPLALPSFLSVSFSRQVHQAFSCREAAHSPCGFQLQDYHCKWQQLVCTGV